MNMNSDSEMVEIDKDGNIVKTDAYKDMVNRKDMEQKFDQRAALGRAFLEINNLIIFVCKVDPSLAKEVIAELDKNDISVGIMCRDLSKAIKVLDELYGEYLADKEII